MKRCIVSGKPHRIVFRFSARYYDAEEVIHKRISWNWENISKSGPEVRPNIMKNWIFNEKMHRIRKTSQNRLRFLTGYYEAEEVIHQRISLNWENISKSGPKLGQKWWKIESLMKRCIGSAKPEQFFAFSQDITMLKKWFISAFPEIEKISQNLGPNLWKIEI